MHEGTMMETTVAASIPKERPANSAAALTSASSAAFVTKSIILQRQHHHQGYGFCLRGGVEHGVGHFVSSVDEGSIAEAQGIVAGDQIICVDGLPLMTATHKEAVAFISIRNKLKLQIKRMGVIPTKKNLGESIEWIHCDREAAKQIMKQDNMLAIEKMCIDLGDDHVTKGLGCSICKGPPERPGIYVQSIKTGGAALRSGLQLGDQILACNDMTFEGNSLNFNVAVAQMRGRRFLDLIIRRGAGLDIVLASNDAQQKTTPQNQQSQEEHRNRTNLLEDEKRLLQSQVQLERRKLEAEQERLRVEAMRLENERLKLTAEKERLLKSAAKKTNSTTLSSTASAGSSTSSSSSAHPSSSTDNSSLESSSSGGGLASAIQSELKRRAQANFAGSKANHVPKPIIKANLTENGKKSLLMQHNDQHDQLIAEFRKVHRKLFSSANMEAAAAGEQEDDIRVEGQAEDLLEEAQTSAANNTEDMHGGQRAGDRELVVVHNHGNRSYDETLVKPTKTVITNTPLVPTPPPRMESSHLANMSSEFASVLKVEENSGSSDSGSPGIPTPDYDTMTTNFSSASPEPKIDMNKMRISSPEPSNSSSHKVLVKTKSDPRTKTFSKRHPPVVETASNSASVSGSSVTSFKSKSTENLLDIQEKVPTANYFELVRHVHAAESELVDQFNFGPSQIQHKDKNVRFKESSEAAVATQDYRIAHATRKALRYTSDLHKTLAVRSGGALNNAASTASNSASASSSGVSSSPSRSSPRCLSSSEEEEMLSERRGRARSPKKYPAPPPPPPPAPPSGGCAPQDKVENASTSNLLPKNVTVKGID